MITTMKSWFAARPTARPWRLIFAACGLLALYQLHQVHLDDHLYHALKSAWRQAAPASAGMALGSYQVRVEAHPVAQVQNNLSGLAFDEDRDQLWAVVNNPETLLALSRDGHVLGQYPLSGFIDVEGVAYLGDDLLVVLEERSQAVHILPVPTSPGSIHRHQSRSLTLALGDGDNLGFEGVDYDRAGDRLFVVKEKSPMKLYEIRGLKGSMNGALNIEVIDRAAWLADQLPVSDLSSVHYDARSGHLALLSDESQIIVELDGEGRLVSSRPLWSGFAGLERGVPQAEGMTFDGRGDLYLVSEPNLFYVFSRQ
ncbi:DNA-binding protein [Stutzerimonas nosocomialis]|nr:DNA-binding protein [Stutzerimonas nosocomialis]